MRVVSFFLPKPASSLGPSCDLEVWSLLLRCDDAQVILAGRCRLSLIRCIPHLTERPYVMPFRPLIFLVMLLLSVMLVSPVDAVETLGGMSRINPSWTGDYDGMLKRRAIRVLVTYSKTFYFMDGGNQRGLSYEMIQSFEKHINRQQKKNPLKVNVFIIPVARDELLPALD